ncbi:MAG: tRNA (adenosine(37)-N6)-threonylcarbamoyltransferase complex dimerization subunit type 1 TsaB [Planctomycetota bacterium]
MKVLAVETSSEQGSLALWDSDTGRIWLKSLTPGFTHARELVPGIERLIEEAGVEQPDLIACGQGPGSYTGLRIGLAVARALGFAWDKPTYGVSSLEALAATEKEGRPAVLATADAKKGEIYWALYEPSGNRPTLLKGPQVGTPWDIGDVPRGTIVLGDGASIVQRCSQHAELPADPARRPRAREVAVIAGRAFAAGVRQEPESLLPLYLRPSEAEIRWSKRKQKSGEQVRG